MKQGKAHYVPLSALDSTLAAQRGVHAQRDKAILMLSHYMGLRAKELAALTIGDIFDANTGQIRDVVRLLAVMTKGQRFREVFLVNTKARDILRVYLTSRSLRCLDSPLFLSQRGGCFSPNTMQRLIAIMYHRAGVRGSSHSGRRSYATHLIELGADIHAVKELLGHSSIVTTQEYFSTNPTRLKNFVGLLR